MSAAEINETAETLVESNVSSRIEVWRETAWRGPVHNCHTDSKSVVLHIFINDETSFDSILNVSALFCLFQELCMLFSCVFI